MRLNHITQVHHKVEHQDQESEVTHKRGTINGIPDPVAQPNDGVNGNAVPNWTETSWKHQDPNCKKHVFEGIPGGAMNEIGIVGEAPEQAKVSWDHIKVFGKRVS